MSDIDGIKNPEKVIDYLISKDIALAKKKGQTLSQDRISKLRIEYAGIAKFMCVTLVD